MHLALPQQEEWENRHKLQSQWNAFIVVSVTACKPMSLDTHTHYQGSRLYQRALVLAYQLLVQLPFTPPTAASSFMCEGGAPDKCI